MVKNKGCRILIIEDEAPIRKLLQVALSVHGYVVDKAVSGQEGITKTTLFMPELIILDLGLPDIDGLEVLKTIREWSKIPIIILSVKGHEQDKIMALNSGADDYVTKPFSMGELIARIDASLRYADGVITEPTLSFDDLVIDLSYRKVMIGGNEIKLSPIEYDLLKSLALHAGKVLTHRQLLLEVWGPKYEKDTQYLRVYVGLLRRKVEVNPSKPRHIITEPGVGYRLL